MFLIIFSQNNIFILHVLYVGFIGLEFSFCFFRFIVLNVRLIIILVFFRFRLFRAIFGLLCCVVVINFIAVYVGVIRAIIVFCGGFIRFIILFCVRLTTSAPSQAPTFSNTTNSAHTTNQQYSNQANYSSAKY